MYITKTTFHLGDGKVIESGAQVTAKDLGLKRDDIKRYIDLGALTEAPKAAKTDEPEAEK